jgi:chromate transporter
VNLLLLYLEFFKIGLFSVGGGYSTLPFLFRMAKDEFVFIRQTGWLSQEMLGNFLAIAQSSPGAIGVNMAAQTGFSYAGFAGSIIAALGLISPAIIVISVIARALTSFKENKIVVSVFSGLRPAAGGLLAAAGAGVWKLSLYNRGAARWFELLRWKECAIFAAIFLLIIKLKFHPVIFIAIGAGIGILLGLTA